MEKNKEGIGNKGKEGFADLKGCSVPPSSKGLKESREQAARTRGGRVLPAGTSLCKGPEQVVCGVVRHSKKAPVAASKSKGKIYMG